MRMREVRACMCAILPCVCAVGVGVRLRMRVRCLWACAVLCAYGAMMRVYECATRGACLVRAVCVRVSVRCVCDAWMSAQTFKSL